MFFVAKGSFLIGESKLMANSNGFKYQERSANNYEKRANQSAKEREGFIREGIPFFTPKPKLNRLRILPPTWDDPEHYGYDVFVHYSIGPDNSSFICKKRMLKEACPICDEKKAAEARGDIEYAKSLEEKKRVLVWVIDRAEEKEGPQLWAMPWTIDKDLVKLAVESDPTGSNSLGDILRIDHPDKGYDFQFEREGTKLTTKYTQLKILERRSTPISLDAQQAEDWLSYIVDNPLPSCLVYAEAKHIGEVLNGHSFKSTAEEAAPVRDIPAAVEAEDLTYETLAALSERELMAVASRNGMSKVALKGASQEELVDLICEELNIAIPAEEDIVDPPVEQESIADRLASLRNRRK